MASANSNVAYSCDGVTLETYLLPPYSPNTQISSCAQVELNFNIKLINVHPPLGSLDFYAVHLRKRLDLHIFHDQVRARRLLEPFLPLVIDNPYSVNLNLNELRERIIYHGVQLANFASVFPGYSVYPLGFEITGTIEHHNVHPNMEQEEHVVIMDALGESEEDYDYGMIPAEELSIKNLLKTVKIRGVDENCAICLEELEVGSDASMMPCCHSFHENCVERWLKQSHSCPLCRFEMSPQSS